MNTRLLVRRFLLVCITLFLLVLAWGAVAGGVRQFPRSITVWQQVETIVQLACGLLSLLIVFTYFWWRKWSTPIRVAWAISLVTAAGLSSLVWGPPMPLTALVLAGIALFIALVILWALQRLSAGDINTEG